MKRIMKVFILVLFIVAHFGKAQGSYDDEGQYDGDEDCIEAHYGAINRRPLSSRLFMWWPYEECSNGRTYVTCGRDLKCKRNRGLSWSTTPATRTLWTHSRGTSSVSEANDLVDTVLQNMMPTLIWEESVFLSLPSHYFKVYSTAWTNNDLEVEIISARLKNLNTAVRRNDDCVLAMVAGNVSVSCDLSIYGVVAELVTETEGDSLFEPDKKFVRVSAQMYGTTGRLEVTSRRNQPGFLRTFVVGSAYFEVTPGYDLDLNSIRMKNFKSNISHYLGQQLEQKFRYYYETMLAHAFSRMSFFLF